MKLLVLGERDMDPDTRSSSAQNARETARMTPAVRIERGRNYHKVD